MRLRIEIDISEALIGCFWMNEDRLKPRRSTVRCLTGPVLLSIDFIAQLRVKRLMRAGTPKEAPSSPRSNSRLTACRQIRPAPAAHGPFSSSSRRVRRCRFPRQVLPNSRCHFRKKPDPIARFQPSFAWIPSKARRWRRAIPMKGSFLSSKGNVGWAQSEPKPAPRPASQACPASGGMPGIGGKPGIGGTPGPPTAARARLRRRTGFAGGGRCRRRREITPSCSRKHRGHLMLGNQQRCQQIGKAALGIKPAGRASGSVWRDPPCARPGACRLSLADVKTRIGSTRAN